MVRLQAQGVDLAGHDADVGASVEHATRNFRVGFFLKIDVDIRIGRQKARQDFRQKIGHCGGVH